MTIRTRLVSATAALLLVLAAGFGAGTAQAAPDEDSGTLPPEELRVMTYNIRYDNKSTTHAWADRLPLMADQLTGLRPDLLGVQEALNHQVTDLADALPGYAWIGQGREGGTKGEYMGIFYRTDRLELMDSGDFWLSDTASVPGSKTWGNRIPRMVTWGLFSDVESGEVFYHYNTHFDCNSTCGNTNAKGDEIRMKSAQLISERTADLPHPVILTGDFNEAGGTTNAYRYLTDEAGFGDTWEESERRGPIVGTFNNYGEPELGGDRIDWILRQGPVRTELENIDLYGDESGEYPSDHLPIVAEVVIGEEPEGARSDKVAPNPIPTLAATAAAEADAITLSWPAGSDNLGVESYNIYATTDPAAGPSAATLLASTAKLSFLHKDLGLGASWHYWVSAVDRRGNIGAPSPVASATTDARKLMFEAEDGLPLLAGSAESRSQANCCGLDWSSDHQLLVLSSAVDDFAAFTVDLPTPGTFALTVDATTANDFATWTMAIDGEIVGTPYDAYTPTIQLAKGIEVGTAELGAGEHTITFTATGRNAESANYRMGIDAIHLTLTD